MKSLHLAQPRAIMMVGIPGSGKSFFASQFSDMFNVPYVDSLFIEDKSADGQKASELVAFMLGEITKTGQSFIYEGNSDSRTLRTDFSKWARAHNYQSLFVWVQADKATSLKRSLKMKTLTQEQFESALQGFVPPHPDEKPIVISGKHTYASQARAVLSYLGLSNRPARPVAPPVRPIRIPVNHKHIPS